MYCVRTVALALGLVGVAGATSKITTAHIDTHLQDLKAGIFPDLEAISRRLYAHPEISRNETFAHAITVDFFQNKKAGEWEVVADLNDELPTAWSAEFSHRPAGWPRQKPLPSFGFMAEYDALIEANEPSHACGHNHIWLVATYAASLARQALIDFDIAGRIIVIGSPDEEQNSGKFVLDEAGVYDGSLIWALGHPSITPAIQPMSARQNLIVRVVKDTHFQVVKEAYMELVPLVNLTGLPGQFSTAALIEEVGMFQCNVVQADIALGVVGPSVAQVTATLNAVKASNPGFASTNFTLSSDPELEGGVQIFIVGNAGHASSTNQGALTMSILGFQQLVAQDPAFEFYLPHNRTHPELEYLIDARTRWSPDMPALVTFLQNRIPNPNITLDREYPAVEVDPFLGPLFINTVARPAYGSQTFPLSKTPPAASDASWVQRAVVSPNGDGTFSLESVRKATLHANYDICTSNNITLCPFNHEPHFADLAGADFAYVQTEEVARAIAAMAVQLLADPDLMAQATAHVAAGPKNRRR